MAESITRSSSRMKDLKELLMEVFEDKDETEYLKMIDELKNLGISNALDLRYLNENSLKETESFTEIEMKKLFDVSTNPKSKTLHQVLTDIFYGTPEERVNEIEKSLIDYGIYSGQDIFIIDIPNMKKETSLTGMEISKIEQYIRRHDKEKDEEIKSHKQYEAERRHEDQKFQLKERDTHWNSLVNEKSQLIDECTKLEKQEIEMAKGNCGSLFDLKLFGISLVTVGGNKAENIRNALEVVRSTLTEKKKKIKTIDEKLQKLRDTSKTPKLAITSAKAK